MVRADQSWADDGSAGMKASQPNPCWVLRGQVWPEIHLQTSQEEREYSRLCLERGRARFLLFASLSQIQPPSPWPPKPGGFAAGGAQGCGFICFLCNTRSACCRQSLGWELSCLLADTENCNLCACLGEKECLFMGGKCVCMPAHAWERVFVWKCVCEYIYIYMDAPRLC